MMINKHEASANDPIGGPLLQGLSSRVRSNQAAISGILDMVESMQRLFRQTSIVCEQQCRYSADVIRMLLTPVQQLLDTASQLPASLKSQCCTLIRVIQEVNTVGNDLALRITQYPSTHQGSSYPTVAQRWDIQRKFDKLVQGCEDILRQSTFLLDKAS